MTDSYAVIQNGHLWFDAMKDQLVCNATAIMHMSWTDFMDNLQTTTTQPCFLAGSLLHMTITKFHYNQTSTPLPTQVEYTPGDIDIWIYDEKGFETKEIDYESAVGDDFVECDDKTYHLKDALRVAREMARTYKNVKFEGFNVIHSIRATSLKTLLDSFDLDCLRFGYDVHKNEFLLHKETLPSIASLKTKYTFAPSFFPFDPFTEHVVIFEYNSSYSFEDVMKPKYPIVYPSEDFSVFTSKDCIVDSHPCFTMDSLQTTSLNQYVYEYIWKRIRNLNIDLKCSIKVKRAEELGALFDPQTFQYYIPSSESILDFTEFFDCPLFSPSSIKDWYKKGGILVFSVPCPKLFIHLASRRQKFWLCNGVQEGKFSEEDVRFLLYEARVPAEDIFNILNPFYFDGKNNSGHTQYDLNWGYGIMTKISQEFTQLHKFDARTQGSYNFVFTHIFDVMSKCYLRRIRVLQRTKKYKRRGYTIFVEKDTYGRNLSWLWMYEEVEAMKSKRKDRISLNLNDPSILKYLSSFFPRNFQLDLPKDFIKRIHQHQNNVRALVCDETPQNYSREECKFYTMALHPMIIDNRIFRLVTSSFKTYKTQLRIPNDSPVKFIPSLFHPPYKHMNLPHIICCLFTTDEKEKKYFLRVHDEKTFYGIIEHEVKEFWSEESSKQYNLLKKMLKLAKREREHFGNHREHTFALWSLLGSKKDLLNYVVYDTILKRVYIVSVSSFITAYCGRVQEYELHNIKKGFIGFDCMDEK
jgi:hypothetical protein